MLTNEINECPSLGPTEIDSLMQQTHFWSPYSVLGIGDTRIRYGPGLLALVGDTVMLAEIAVQRGECRRRAAPWLSCFNVHNENELELLRSLPLSALALRAFSGAVRCSLWKKTTKTTENSANKLQFSCTLQSFPVCGSPVFFLQSKGGIYLSTLTSLASPLLLYLYVPFKHRRGFSLQKPVCAKFRLTLDNLAAYTSPSIHTCATTNAM